MNSIENILSRLRESALNRVDEADIDEEAYKEFMKKCQDNPTWKKADSICKNYGYTLAPLSYVDVDGRGNKFVKMNIREPRENDYAPEVQYFQERFGNDDPHFIIHTTSVGGLEVEEHAKYVESVSNANKMVQELSKLDYTTLYELKDEE